MEQNNKLLNISKKTFISIVILLGILMVLSIILTYILPKGDFLVLENGTVDYSTFIRNDDLKGINIFKGRRKN